MYGTPKGVPYVYLRGGVGDKIFEFAHKPWGRFLCLSLSEWINR